MSGGSHKVCEGLGNDVGVHNLEKFDLVLEHLPVVIVPASNFNI